jgi:hypothetical protein
MLDSFSVPELALHPLIPWIAASQSRCHGPSSCPIVAVRYPSYIQCLFLRIEGSMEVPCRSGFCVGSTDRMGLVTLNLLLLVGSSFFVFAD